jgi:hypothetical protein
MIRPALGSIGILVVVVGFQHSKLFGALGLGLIVLAPRSTGLPRSSLLLITGVTVSVWLVAGAILASIPNRRTCQSDPTGLERCSTSQSMLWTLLAIAAILSALAVFPTALASAVSRQRRNEKGVRR